MNTKRALVLAGAFVAAIVVALVVSRMLGGRTQTATAIPAPRIAMREVLVAASNITPGTALTPASVRWQAWPRSSTDSSFITQESNPDIAKIVTGAVTRAPLVSGEPLSAAKFVQHAQGTGYMAATVTPGMRAISIPITTETGAGGFILPNDRVDVIATQPLSEQHHFRSRTLLSDIRVLAVDQTYEQKDQKTVLAKTATLELTPTQAEVVERAQAAGTISLALRPLAEADNSTNDASKTAAKALAGAAQQVHQDGEVDVIRYGSERPETFSQKE